MDSGASVMVYQPDYDKLKQMATENDVSIADVISHIIMIYEKTTIGPQVVMQEVKL